VILVDLVNNGIMPEEAYSTFLKGINITTNEKGNENDGKVVRREN
jgi:hypothetical protein